MNVTKTHALRIEAANFFQDPAFVVWLNVQQPPKFSWHQGGAPTSGSDVVVLVDPSLSGEGSDSDMPEHIWDSIVEECRRHFLPNSSNGVHIMVWLVNG